MGAWRFYIPAFVKGGIVPNSEVIIPATNDKLLAEHFGCAAVFEEATRQRTTFDSGGPRPSATRE